MPKEPAIVIEMPEGIEELVPASSDRSQKEGARAMAHMLSASDWEGIRRIAHDLKGMEPPSAFLS